MARPRLERTIRVIAARFRPETHAFDFVLQIGSTDAWVWRYQDRGTQQSAAQEQRSLRYDQSQAPSTARSTAPTHLVTVALAFDTAVHDFCPRARYAPPTRSTATSLRGSEMKPSGLPLPVHAQAGTPCAIPEPAAACQTYLILRALTHVLALRVS
eukprot:2489908-Rhodomonas_salina.3